VGAATRTQLAAHFKTLEPMLKDRATIENQIKQIYDNSPFQAKGEEIDKYSVYASRTGAATGFKMSLT
jgi:hypothetical protein